MKIIVKILFGKSFALDVDQSDTIEDVKAKIYGKRFPSDPYNLLFNGEQLVDGRKLLEYDISDGYTIQLVWQQAVDDDDAEITRIHDRKTRFSKDFLSRHNETSSFSAVNNSSGYVSGYVDTTYYYENCGQILNGSPEKPRGSNSLMNNYTFASRSCINLTTLNDDSENYDVFKTSSGGNFVASKNETIASADKVDSAVQKSEAGHTVTNDAGAENSQICDAKIDEKNQEISVLQDEKERLATENAALKAEIDQMRNQRSRGGDFEQSSIVEAPRKSNVFMNNTSSFVHSGNDITSLDDGYGSTRFSQSFAGGNSFASKEKTGPSNKLDSIVEHSDVGDKVNVDSGVEKSIPSKNEQENQESVSPSEDAGNGNEELYADISFNNVTINNDDNESEKFNDSIISNPFVRQNVYNVGRSLLDYSVHTISDSTFNGTITLGDTPVIPDTPAFRKRTKHDLRNLFLQNAVKSENVDHSGEERFNDSVISVGDSVRQNVNNVYSALDYSVFTTSDSPNNGILGDTPILPDTPGFRRRTQQQPYDLTPAFRSRNVNRGERREPFIDEESFISKEDPYDLDYQINTPATTVDISDDERSFETDDELPSRPWNSPMIRGIRCYCTTGCEKEICNCLKHGVNCNINCHPRFDCYNGFVFR